MEDINGTIVEMKLIAEGAISLYEKNKKPDAEAYRLIGEALHMIQERISYCLLSSQSDA